jgi:hypothetical protein
LGIIATGGLGGSDVPDLERLQALGDAHNESLACWIKRYAGDDQVRQEAIAKNLDQLRDELTEPADNALERLLVKQIVLTQMIVNYSAAVLAQTGTTHLSTLRYLDTRLEKTTRRLTHLAKMLELLRKSRRKTVSPKAVVPTAKQNGQPLVPESRFPT